MALPRLVSMESSAADYLRRHELEPYLEDLVRACLLARDEKPAERARDYFLRVLGMGHVLGRECDYVSATVWNRGYFVVVFHSTIVVHLLSKRLPMANFHQLLTLLCPNFPRAALDAVTP